MCASDGVCVCVTHDSVCVCATHGGVRVCVPLMMVCLCVQLWPQQNHMTQPASLWHCALWATLTLKVMWCGIVWLNPWSVCLCQVCLLLCTVWSVCVLCDLFVYCVSLFVYCVICLFTVSVCLCTVWSFCLLCESVCVLCGFVYCVSVCVLCDLSVLCESGAQTTSSWSSA